MNASRKTRLVWLVALLSVLTLGAGSQEPDAYPKAKAKSPKSQGVEQAPVVPKDSLEAQCLGGMKFIGDRYPRSIEGQRYPETIDSSAKCPVGGEYLYARGFEQPGNDPGFQSYFLIRCRAPEHANIGYNSIDGPVDPTELKSFRLRTR